jgi:hypothetical protein
MKEEKDVTEGTSSDSSGKIYHAGMTKGAIYRAMLRRVRRPLRPPAAGSSGLGRTRSIFDITLIQGTSRLTIADMADKTPL